MDDKGYLVEMQRVGNVVRVTAIDPVTGREAVIQGPAGAGETLLARTAVNKLAYLLGKKQKG